MPIWSASPGKTVRMSVMATPATPANQVPTPKTNMKEHGYVDAEGVDHVRIGHGRPHDHAQACFVKERGQNRQHHEGQSDDEQSIDRVVETAQPEPSLQNRGEPGSTGSRFPRRP
jgi:hypothetical protein